MVKHEVSNEVIWCGVPQEMVRVRLALVTVHLKDVQEKMVRHTYTHTRMHARTHTHTHTHTHTRLPFTPMNHYEKFITAV